MVSNNSQEFKGKYGANQARSFPNIYLGSKSINGVIQAFVEIFGNSLDEATSGFGDRIYVSINEDNSYTIRDYGRGVPLGWNPDFLNEDGTRGQWNWHVVYNQLYSSGKYGSNQELLHRVDAANMWDRFDWKKVPYLFTVGMHGVGATAVQQTSEYFEVTSYYDGQAHSMRFEAGYPVWEELRVVPSPAPSGTEVTFLPDPLVFEETVIPPHRIDTMLKSTAITSGVTMIFENKPKGTREEYAGSSVDAYMAEHNSGDYSYRETFFKKKISGTFIIDDQRLDSKIQVCVARVAISPYFDTDRYVNNQIPVSSYSGSHSSAVMDVVSDFFKRELSKRGIKVKPEDFGTSFTVFVDTLSNDKGYHGQTKDQMDNAYIYEAIAENLDAQLRAAVSSGAPWMKKILDRVYLAAQSRMSRASTKEEREAVRRVVNRKALPKKFTSCSAYERGHSEEVELWLVEGESAKVSVLDARLAESQALYSLRGKMLNPFNITVKEAMKNQEISDIVNIVGVGIAQNPEDYDYRRRKVGKIVIASDADDDGYHIRNLAFLVIHQFMPDFLYEGKVFIAETPKYGVPAPNGEIVTAVDDVEYEELRKSRPELDYSRVERYKGLGQVDAEVLHRSVMNPATRNLTRVQVNPDDVEVYNSIRMMYGEDTEVRKSLVLDQFNPEGYAGFLAMREDLQKAQSKFIEELGEINARVVSL